MSTEDMMVGGSAAWTPSDNEYASIGDRMKASPFRDRLEWFE